MASLELLKTFFAAAHVLLIDRLLFKQIAVLGRSKNYLSTAAEVTLFEKRVYVLCDNQVLL